MRPNPLSESLVDAERHVAPTRGGRIMGDTKEQQISPTPWKWQGEDYRFGWGWQMLVDANGNGIIVGDENGKPSRHLRGYMPVDKKLCIAGLVAEKKPRVNAVHVFSEANARLIAAAPDLYEACKEQHNAMDMLFAMLIERDKTFFPSKSGQPWEAMMQGNKVIAKAEGK